MERLRVCTAPVMLLFGVVMVVGVVPIRAPDFGGLKTEAERPRTGVLIPAADGLERADAGAVVGAAMPLECGGVLLTALLERAGKGDGRAPPPLAYMERIGVRCTCGETPSLRAEEGAEGVRTEGPDGRGDCDECEMDDAGRGVVSNMILGLTPFPDIGESG